MDGLIENLKNMYNLDILIGNKCTKQKYGIYNKYLIINL